MTTMSPSTAEATSDNETAMVIVEQMGLGYTFRNCSCGQLPCARLQPIVSALVSARVNAHDALRAEVAKLKDLISHMHVHSGYSNCGYIQMTTEQKTLYDALWAEDVTAMDVESAALKGGG